VTVSEYSARMSRILRSVGGAVVEGEVQKPKRSASGAFWFSLTDGSATLTCKVFRRQAEELEHVPREGDLVRVEVERPDLWIQAGKLDLIVGQIRLAGEGELLRRRQELIDRLSTEGLCDPTRRRSLPKFPRAVGVIAGTNSDAMSDVVQALLDRWPCIHIVTCGSLVQGKRAPRDLIDALARMTEHPLVDVVVIARGGGSVQDLACFDDEGLCRAVFACELPVVCAIGHTDNNPVCNHIAWAAYTPSRSAELVVPSASQLRRDIAAIRGCLDNVPRSVRLVSERLAHTNEQLHCTAKLEAHTGQVRELSNQIQGALGNLLVNRKHGVQYGQGVLDAVPHRAIRDLSTKRERLFVATSAVADTAGRIDRLTAEVRGFGNAARIGTRRQCDDHTRDYRRALHRLLREARAGIDRRIDRANELINREGIWVGERSRRRLDDARREATHAGAVISARDFRTHGWLLATSNGGPVHSTADLQPGQHIDLHLHDGNANVVVETIDPDNWSKAS
jgi:exodeoxyribonuclease VII large subunit